MSALLQDVRYGLRMCAVFPGVTAVAVLSLTLGIAAVTTIFSLMNSVLLRPLPAAQPEKLVRIGSTLRGEGFGAFSYLEYTYYREHNEVFDGLLAHQPFRLSRRSGDGTETTWGEIVSGNYFDVLGVRAFRGRTFLPEEDRPGAGAAVVISHRLWEQRYAGDPNLIGQTIHLNGHPFTVVGVASPGFSGTFVGFAIELWVPVATKAQALPDADSLQRMDSRFLMLIGRRRPEASLDQVRAAVTTLAAQLEQSHPDSNRDVGASVAAAGGVHPFLATFLTPFLSLLMVVVGLVLLIACANVANLLLARATTRQREMAVRLALGAGKLRLVRQLLTESVLLGLLAGMGGLLLSLWTTRLLAGFRPPTDVPLALFDVKTDWRVFVFAAGVSALAGIAFGLAPALQSARADLASALKGQAGLDQPKSAWLRNSLVSAQLAVSLVLLVGSGLLIRSLRNSRTLDPGFDPSGVAVLSFDPQLIGYTKEKAFAFYGDVVRQVRALPGVESAALAGWAQLGERGDSRPVTVPGHQPAPNRRGFDIAYNLVGPSYFRTMRIPLLLGRDVNERDRAGSPPVVIINETTARRFWSGEDPIGQTLRVAWESRDRQVIGVVRDSKYRSVAEEPQPYLYFPLEQESQRFDATLHVRGTGDPRALLEPVRRLATALEQDMPIHAAQTMADSMAFSITPARIAGVVLTVSGCMALLLALTGLYGVVAYATSRRTREMGIRLALGAARSDLIRLVVRQGAGLAAVGLVIGVGLALVATRVLKVFLYGVAPTDPATFAGIGLLLAAVALAASYIPARRAARTDPVQALRYE